jgi:hypothetical protein
MTIRAISILSASHAITMINTIGEGTIMVIDMTMMAIDIIATVIDMTIMVMDDKTDRPSPLKETRGYIIRMTEHQ